ncbi:MAG TPA: type II toxin-antitoxin system PemK/MazF family toxin [Verrucomicrobiae bacterium]
MPNRGEVWLVDLGMVQKVRPALILNRAFRETDRALISVIPHTTALRGSDLEIEVNVAFLQPGAFLVQNPITIPAVKAERFLGRLTTQQLVLVEVGVRNWLSL